MRHLLLYKQVKGVPRRLLSVSSRASGGGQFHESDDCVPKEFIEAMYSMPEEARPHPGVLLQRDMTPELIAEKAAKYNILPEDYMPMSITCSGGFGGDYPTIVEESQYNKEFNFEWDNFNHKRNYGEIWGMFQHTHRAATMCQIYDGSFHPYGLYQYWQMWYLYFAWVFFLLYGYFIHSWLFTPFTYSSFDRWTRALQNTCLHKDRSWSKTELEWLDVFLKVEQAKDGYANRSHADHDWNLYRTGSIWFSKFGTYAGRFRHGPTGCAPINGEKVDSYMCPAGPMSFKLGHHMPGTVPAPMVFNHPHPSHGHGTEMADLLSTEIGKDYE